MTDKKCSPMTNSDDEYVRIMQKLQTKHDDLFEKIVFAQREDKQDVAQSHASEIIAVRKMISFYFSTPIIATATIAMRNTGFNN